MELNGDNMQKPLFQRRHYEIIANVINDVLVDEMPPLDLITALADKFEVDNPKFDRSKFFNACLDLRSPNAPTR